MNTDPNQSPFNKAIMTGLFAGLTATICCFIFEIAYRYNTGYQPSEVINVSSLIFVVNILLVACGIFYYYFKKLFIKGDVFFEILFILVTLFCIWKAEGVQRFADAQQNLEFAHLLSGTIFIIGICAIGIPVLINNKKFNQFFI